MKHRQIRGPRSCALATANLLRHVVEASEQAEAPGLIARVQEVGRRLIAAHPAELAIGNVVRRVLGVIRGEAEEARDDVRADAVDGIDEIIDELEIVDDQIAAAAPEHVRATDVVIAHGSSRTVQRFALAAAAAVPAHSVAGAKFTMIHAADPPDQSLPPMTTTPSGEDDLDTLQFTKPLLDAKIEVVHVSLAAAYALMPRVHRVLLTPQAILPDGSMVCAAGSWSLAEAARAHRRPVLALGGVFKLSPELPPDVDALIEYGGLGEEEAWEGHGQECQELIEVENPLTEHVPAVDLYITNL